MQRSNVGDRQAVRYNASCFPGRDERGHIRDKDVWLAPSRNIVVLGSTGSIGTQTLEVAAALPGRLRLAGLSAHSRWDELREQARRVEPRWVTVTDPSLFDQLPKTVPGMSVPVLRGAAGIEAMVTDPRVDTVVAAMVGAAGLQGAVLALEAGKTVALANKETLVVGGPLVTALASQNHCQLLPIDSEHSAILQCLAAGRREEVSRLILTASGGPFRTLPLEQFAAITVSQALKHPTWTMGPKITIDSATMMNKALEIIEAHWLFGLTAEQIAVVIHPQSMIHSMVEFVDGAVVAQLSPPDMRLPIQYALTYPERLNGPARRLDLAKMGSWEFEPVDLERYPAVSLGYAVVEQQGTSGAALNAANEVAVERFLREEIRFTDIVPLCRDVLRHHSFDASPTFDTLERIDRQARQEAYAWNY